MNSEGPIQVEPSSSSHGHHDTEQVQTVLESTSSPPLSESMTKSTEMRSHMDDADLSATVEAEVESTAVLDCTLVEGGDEAEGSTKKHAKVSSANSLPFPFKGHGSKTSGDSHDGSIEGGSPTPWHPLNTMEKGETQGYDHSMVLVEDDIGETKGKLLYGQTDMKTFLNRTSHLHLELKPGSPQQQPWDSIEPPLENNLKSMEGYYSPTAAVQQKFHTMQKIGWVFFFSFFFFFFFYKTDGFS